MKILSHMLSIFSFLLISLSPSSQAAESGTADEAVAMVESAIKLIKKKGLEESFAEFNNQKGAFVDRDLYISVIDENGVMLSTGGNPKLIKKNLIELKDVDGKQFVKELIGTAQKKGSGWVDLKWVNPVSKLIQQKSAYVEKYENLAVICGIYK